MSAPTPQPTFQELMASVGFVFLYWGNFELAHRRAKAKGIVYSDEIRDEISRVRALRNLIAHGIFNGSARPLAGEESHILCAASTDETESLTYTFLTYSDLNEAAQMIDLLRLKIEALNREADL